MSYEKMAVCETDDMAMGAHNDGAHGVIKDVRAWWEWFGGFHGGHAYSMHATNTCGSTVDGIRVTAALDNSDVEISSAAGGIIEIVGNTMTITYYGEFKNKSGVHDVVRIYSAERPAW